MKLGTSSLRQRVLLSFLALVAVGFVSGYLAFEVQAPSVCYFAGSGVPTPGSSIPPVDVGNHCISPDVLSGAYPPPIGYTDPPVASGRPYPAAGAATGAIAWLIAAALVRSRRMASRDISQR